MQALTNDIIIINCNQLYDKYVRSVLKKKKKKKRKASEFLKE